MKLFTEVLPPTLVCKTSFGEAMTSVIFNKVICEQDFAQPVPADVLRLTFWFSSRAWITIAVSMTHTWKFWRAWTTR